MGVTPMNDMESKSVVAMHESVGEFLDSVNEVLSASSSISDEECDQILETLKGSSETLNNKIREELNKHERVADDLRLVTARAQSDLVNLRRRSESERDEIAQRVRDQFALKVMEVSDQLSDALEYCEDADESWLDGFRGIAKNLGKAMEDEGYRRFDSAGLRFDASRHDAAQIVETDDFDEGAIVRVIRDGYECKSTGRVVRPALVAIAKAPSECASVSENYE